MHKVVVPELERRVLDELDERDEQSPRVGPVHDQPLQQHPETSNGNDDDDDDSTRLDVTLNVELPCHRDVQVQVNLKGQSQFTNRHYESRHHRETECVTTFVLWFFLSPMDDLR